jgi:hypothetical protein
MTPQPKSARCLVLGAILFVSCIVSLSTTSKADPCISLDVEGLMQVGANLANTCITTLTLEKNATLKFDPAVQSYQWKVSRIHFEEGATIDLSASLTKPPPAPTPPRNYNPAVAPECTDGINGASATVAGTAGARGVTLTITGVDEIDQKGSLWFKTDGGPGGDGGNGVDGQIGGGNKGCQGGRGGNGGNASDGGVGGATSLISLTYSDPHNKFGTQSNCATTCSSVQTSARPPDAIGTTGQIGIFGAPGCGGYSGNWGQGSPSGMGGNAGYGDHGWGTDPSNPKSAIQSAAGICTPVAQ